jgi:hypothetical protein
MAQEHDLSSDGDDLPRPLERLLTGLWHQRAELGLIAEELLDIFRRHGLTPPVDDSKER